MLQDCACTHANGPLAQARTNQPPQLRVLAVQTDAALRVVRRLLLRSVVMGICCILEMRVDMGIVRHVHDIVSPVLLREGFMSELRTWSMESCRMQPTASWVRSASMTECSTQALIKSTRPCSARRSRATWLPTVTSEERQRGCQNPLRVGMSELWEQLLA